MAEDVISEVSSGRIRGQTSGGVDAFRGIPYGRSVSGRRRWRRSSPVVPWTGVRDTIEYGPRAIQPESRDAHVTSQDFEDLMAAGGPPHDRWRGQSEECLTLSVWAPTGASGQKLPVMFWCHGGKYFGETPPVWWFDGENLAARENVVVVTVRHRVGVLGFLHLADLPGGGDHGEGANVGLLDLVDALEWVKADIASFGGDPDNVTIFGESGGGLKVSVLLGMPQAQGLFHKAIVQSGAQLEARSRAEGTEAASALMAELGLRVDEIDKLFDMAPEQLVAAQTRLTPNLWVRSEVTRSAEFEPIVDGETLPRDAFNPIASGLNRRVPLLVGTCATETTFFLGALPGAFEMGEAQMRGMVAGMSGPKSGQVLNTYLAGRPDATPTDVLIAVTSDFIFRRKAIRMAEMKVEQGGAPAFMYVLAFETDVHGGKFQTPHILDLPLVFAHPDHPILGGDPARYDVSRQMSGAWAAFARTGDPGSALLPAWPAYDTDARSTMVFEKHPHLEFDPRPEERKVWVA